MAGHNLSAHLIYRILSQLRAAAGPQTKFLLGDLLLRAACALDKTEAGALATNDRAATTLSASTTMDSGSTLLPNFGAESITAYLVDIMVRFLLPTRWRVFLMRHLMPNVHSDDGLV